MQFFWLGVLCCICYKPVCHSFATTKQISVTKRMYLVGRDKSYTGKVVFVLVQVHCSFAACWDDTFDIANIRDQASDCCTRMYLVSRDESCERNVMELVAEKCHLCWCACASGQETHSCQKETWGIHLAICQSVYQIREKGTNIQEQTFVMTTGQKKKQGYL